MLKYTSADGIVLRWSEDGGKCLYEISIPQQHTETYLIGMVEGVQMARKHCAVGIKEAHDAIKGRTNVHVQTIKTVEWKVSR